MNTHLVCSHCVRNHECAYQTEDTVDECVDVILFKANS
jgi:hypothetical protein